MANVIDGDLVLQQNDSARILWQNIATGILAGTIFFSAANPNGVITAPAGSVAFGPGGPWVNTDGAVAWIAIGGGGGGVIETFVYTQTGVADPANGIYDDWATMITAVAALTSLGRKARIMLWGDVNTLPAGLWSFENIEELTSQYGPSGATSLFVTAADGFRLTALPDKITGISLDITNTVDPVWEGADFNLGRSLTMVESHINSTELQTQPFIRFTAIGAASKRIAVYGTGGSGGFAFNNSWGPGGGELIDLSVAGPSLRIELFDLMGLSNDSVKGVAGSTFTTYLVVPAAQSPKAGQTLSTYFSTFLGTMSVIRGYNLGSLSTGIVLAVNTPSTYSHNDGYMGAWVFGDVNLAGDGAANAATIIWEVETAVASGIYTAVQTLSVPPLDSVARRVAFGFFAPVGRRWRWQAGGLAGVTETVNPFNRSEW